MKPTKLDQAAERAVNQALRIRKGEKYLLVTDTPKLEIAEALAYHAKRAGAEVTTYLMTETLRPITGPTGQFKELIRSANVTTYLLEGRFPEKPFRGFMVAEGAKHGRICMMPGITKDMMERLVAIDFSEMARFTKKVIIVYDADKAGEIATLRGLDLLIEEGLEVKIARLNSDTLLISYHHNARVFLQKEKNNSIAILYETFE